MKTLFEHIIVGSGPGAVMAAQTLTEAGMSVLMLDIGFKDEKYSVLPPDDTFGNLRRFDEKQHRYFLGDDFEALPQSEIKTGAQLTPARRHIIKGVDKWSPVVSENFFPMESLALGGLGAGWGLGVYAYSEKELTKAGLPAKEMQKAYDIVASRIGVSCGNDDVSPFIIGKTKNIQEPLKPDNSVRLMLKKYKKKRKSFLDKGIYFGLPSMAILTNDFDGRKAVNYHDMDFYTDKGRAAWRPAFTVEKLTKADNFTYRGGIYVMRFEETKEGVKVYALETGSGNKIEFAARKLLLGAGAFGTARIVMRSLKINTLPLLCNPYTYMPAVNISMLGKTLDERKSSMAQAMMIYDPDGSGEELVSVALFTYRSLLLMRLIQQSPFNITDNRKIFTWLQPAFVIAGIHHPDDFYDKKQLQLVRHKDSPTGDALKINFEIGNEETRKIKEREAVIKSALVKLGVIPIKKINPGFGASIHYGGTLPFDEKGNAGTSNAEGRLNGTRSVYAVDGSSFNFLPAKGITFSIMANAHRVAQNILNND